MLFLMMMASKTSMASSDVLAPEVSRLSHRNSLSILNTKARDSQAHTDKQASCKEFSTVVEERTNQDSTPLGGTSCEERLKVAGAHKTPGAYVPVLFEVYKDLRSRLKKKYSATNDLSKIDNYDFFSAASGNVFRVWVAPSPCKISVKGGGFVYFVDKKSNRLLRIQESM